VPANASAAVLKAPGLFAGLTPPIAAHRLGTVSAPTLLARLAHAVAADRAAIPAPTLFAHFADAVAAEARAVTAPTLFTVVANSVAASRHAIRRAGPRVLGAGANPVAAETPTIAGTAQR